MNRRLPSMMLTKLALLTALVGGLSCAPEKQHEVLTFFFDGVPPLGGPEQTKPSRSRRRRPPPGRAAQAGARRLRAQAHSRREWVRRLPQPAASFALVKPLAELCITCHADKTRQFPQMHGPVAVGECAECHDGHRSAYPHLLLKPVPTVVLPMPRPNAPGRKTWGCPRPSDDADCTNCHNPHGGKDRFFLVSPAEPKPRAASPAAPVRAGGPLTMARVAAAAALLWLFCAAAFAQRDARGALLGINSLHGDVELRYQYQRISRDKQPQSET